MFWCILANVSLQFLMYVYFFSKIIIRADPDNPHGLDTVTPDEDREVYILGNGIWSEYRNQASGGGVSRGNITWFDI